jgi:hypothetical protein
MGWERAAAAGRPCQGASSSPQAVVVVGGPRRGGTASTFRRGSSDGRGAAALAAGRTATVSALRIRVCAERAARQGRMRCRSIGRGVTGQRAAVDVYAVALLSRREKPAVSVQSGGQGALGMRASGFCAARACAGSSKRVDRRGPRETDQRDR